MTAETETLGQWLKALSARSPAPSGGAATALTLASSAGLATMVARFSTSQVNDADELVEKANSLCHRAFLLAAADEAAWSRVGEASKIARVGGEAPRPAALPEAFVGATEVPLRMLEVAAELAPILRLLAERGNPRLLGDALTGEHLLFGAASAAVSLVRLNLSEVPMHERQRFETELARSEATLHDGSRGRWMAPSLVR
ncbi:MAG: cyclodeaminase/cyclohydrolase family protein [Actinomycetota bacterium]|nr:cyclodeaminase/cyclohydrolase family protein [Actinomycetota bacterium]